MVISVDDTQYWRFIWVHSLGDIYKHCTASDVSLRSGNIVSRLSLLLSHTDAVQNLPSGGEVVAICRIFWAELQYYNRGLPETWEQYGAALRAVEIRLATEVEAESFRQPDSEANDGGAAHDLAAEQAVPPPPRTPKDRMEFDDQERRVKLDGTWDTADEDAYELLKAWWKAYPRSTFANKLDGKIRPCEVKKRLPRRLKDVFRSGRGSKGCWLKLADSDPDD